MKEIRSWRAQRSRSISLSRLSFRRRDYPDQPHTSGNQRVILVIRKGEWNVEGQKPASPETRKHDNVRELFQAASRRPSSHTHDEYMSGFQQMGRTEVSQAQVLRLISGRFVSFEQQPKSLEQRDAVIRFSGVHFRFSCSRKGEHLGMLQAIRS